MFPEHRCKNKPWAQPGMTHIAPQKPPTYTETTQKRICCSAWGLFAFGFLFVLIFVSGPHVVEWDHSWQYMGTLWDVRVWTLVGCMQGNHSTHYTHASPRICYSDRYHEQLLLLLLLLLLFLFVWDTSCGPRAREVVQMSGIKPRLATSKTSPYSVALNSTHVLLKYKVITYHGLDAKFRTCYFS